MRPILSFLFISFILMNSSVLTLKAEAADRGKITISGKIVDKMTLNPVEYANVVLFKRSDSLMINGTITDSSGTFRINGIHAGKYFLAVSFIGYNKKNIDIDLKSDDKTLYLDTILMENASGSLKEVSIVANVNPVDYRIDKKVINASQQLNSSGGTAIDLLRNVSSVVVDANGTVFVRGSSNFKLLIDNRPSPVQGSEGLEQIPAASVQNIEIITSPSAKYDPEGTAGIINVILKKEKKKGISGILNGSAGMNKKYTTDGMISYNKQKIHAFLGADFQNRFFYPYSLYNRETKIGDTTKYTDYQTFRKTNMNRLLFRSGLDYNFSSHDIITLNGIYHDLFFKRDFDTHTKDWYSYDDSSYYSRLNNNYNLEGQLVSANLGFTHSFPEKEHELSTFILYNDLKFLSKDNMNRYNTPSSFEPTGIPFCNRSFINNFRKYLQIKADYSLPLKKFKFETGYQVDLTLKKAMFNYENFNLNSKQWLADSTLSNKINFSQQIDALYATFGGELWKMKFEFGLRAEYYTRNLDQKTTQLEYGMEMYNFFPSFQISKTFTSDQEVQLRYGRRVNRPDDQALNPYPYFTDAYTIQTGNPSLKPEFIDSYELNYRKNFKWGALTLESYYRQTNNVFSQNIVALPDTRFWIYSENFGTDRTIGTDLGTNVTLYKWWNLISGVSITYSRQKATVSGIYYDVSNLVANCNLSSNFIISDFTKIQISGRYLSPQKLIEGDYRRTWNLSISARQDLFKKKCSLTFSINDIFKSDYYYFDSRKPAYRVYGSFHTEAPLVTLSVGYKFNDYESPKKNQATMNLEGV